MQITISAFKINEMVQPEQTPVRSREWLMGKRITPIVFGSARYGAEKVDGVIVPTPGPHKEEVLLIREAIEQGYDFFDTAQGYGDSELVVGQAAKGSIRDEVIIATKVGMQPDPNVRAAIEQSVQRLGTEPDVMYVHNRWNGMLEGSMDDCLEAVDSAVDKGLAKTIGLSNFRPQELSYALEYLRNPVRFYQAKLNLHDSRDDAARLFWQCRTNNIIFTASSALDRGQGIDDARPEVTEMAGRYAMSVAQLSILAIRAFGIYPVVMSKSPAHMAENKRALTKRIDTADVLQLGKILFKV